MYPSSKRFKALTMRNVYTKVLSISTLVYTVQSFPPLLKIQISYRVLRGVCSDALSSFGTRSGLQPHISIVEPSWPKHLFYNSLTRQLRDRNMRIEARSQVCRKLNSTGCSVYVQLGGNIPPPPFHKIFLCF